MSMIEKIDKDIKEAMKAKEKEKLQAFRYLKSMLLENKTAKKPIDEMEVVIKHCKKLKDSIEIYPEGSEQRAAIENEYQFVSAYLPEQLTEEKVIEIINQIKSNLDNPNMGAIMKELSPQIKGKFDGKKASELVKNSL